MDHKNCWLGGSWQIYNSKEIINGQGMPKTITLQVLIHIEVVTEKVTYEVRYAKIIQNLIVLFPAWAGNVLFSYYYYY